MRTFTYDGLSRLTAETTPEAGGTTYSYVISGTSNPCSGNGDVCSRTDARNVTTTFTYDALSRLTDKSYSDSTPEEAYSYDSTPYWNAGSGKGRLVRQIALTANGWVGQWYSYDAMGRVKNQWDCLLSDCVNGASTYAQHDLMGNLTSLHYQSGRTVTYNYSNAGLPTTVTDSDGTHYVQSATYTPTGQLTGFVEGYNTNFAGITHSYSYLHRLWPNGWTVSTPSGNIFDLSFGYYDRDGNGNILGSNGNIIGIGDSVHSERAQTFNYDSLNRLTSAYTNSTGSNTWGNSYTYDAWGNLLQKAQFSSDRPNYESFSASVNPDHLNRFSGYAYDAAGNMTNDGNHTYTWDAEERMTSGGGATYTYDALSQRARTDNGSATTEYLRFGGQVIAEKNVTAGTWTDYIFMGDRRIASRPSDGSTYYYVADHLGSSRVIATANGTVCFDAVNYPWGRQESASVNTCPPHHQFTGMEHDTETDLNHTWFRQQSPAMGRWLSPDPAGLAAVDLSNPQSLNRYAYALNTPTNSVDAYGLDAANPNDYYRCDRENPDDVIAYAKCVWAGTGGGSSFGGGIAGDSGGGGIGGLPLPGSEGTVPIGNVSLFDFLPSLPFLSNTNCMPICDAVPQPDPVCGINEAFRKTAIDWRIANDADKKKLIVIGETFAVDATGHLVVKAVKRKIFKVLIPIVEVADDAHAVWELWKISKEQSRQQAAADADFRSRLSTRCGIVSQ